MCWASASLALRKVCLVDPAETSRWRQQMRRSFKARRSRSSRSTGVAELLNKVGAKAFDSEDERRFEELISSMGVILSSWNRLRAARAPRAATPEP